MADAFSHTDAVNLLRNKHILFLGDSNIRAQYKDLLWLLNCNTLVENKVLRSRLELSYLGDTLITRNKLHHGRDYQEVRQYNDTRSYAKVDFMFITRCYNRHIEDMFNSFWTGQNSIPDVIIMNSCLWDLNRWGPNGVPAYKDNMVKLMRLMSKCLPKNCLVIWTTALPLADKMRGGLLIKQIKCMEPLLRFEVMEANMFAREVVVNHGFDVLDNHFFLRMQIHRRAKDGIHYTPIAVRFMTNLLLTHVALSWGRDLPGLVDSVLLNKAIARSTKPVTVTPTKIPSGGIFSKIELLSPSVSRTKGIQITFNPQKRTPRKCKFNEEEEQSDNHPPTLHSVVHLTANYMEQPPQKNKFGGPLRRRKRNNRKKNPYYDDRWHYQY